MAEKVLLMCAAACSSAFLALHDAVLDLQRGRVDYAVVGGSSAIFRPATSLAFLRLKCAPSVIMLSAAGLMHTCLVKEDQAFPLMLCNAFALLGHR